MYPGVHKRRLQVAACTFRWNCNFRGTMLLMSFNLEKYSIQVQRGRKSRIYCFSSSTFASIIIKKIEVYNILDGDAQSTLGEDSHHSVLNYHFFFPILVDLRMPARTDPLTSLEKTEKVPTRRRLIKRLFFRSAIVLELPYIVGPTSLVPRTGD